MRISASRRNGVAALVDYDYYWFDWSSLANAQNDGATHIWIWGWQSGTEAIEAYFPAFGNNWCQAWVWSGASRDSSFYSGAALAQNMTVPYMVLGSL